MIRHSEIIDRVKKIISVNGLTSSSFADKIGVPRSSISHVLSGRNNPSLDLIIKILQSFDLIIRKFMYLTVSSYLHFDPALGHIKPECNKIVVFAFIALQAKIICC